PNYQTIKTMGKRQPEFGRAAHPPLLAGQNKRVAAASVKTAATLSWPQPAVCSRLRQPSLTWGPHVAGKAARAGVAQLFALGQAVEGRLAGGPLICDLQHMPLTADFRVPDPSLGAEPTLQRLVIGGESGVLDSKAVSECGTLRLLEGVITHP